MGQADPQKKRAGAMHLPFSFGGLLIDQTRRLIRLPASSGAQLLVPCSV